MRLRLGFAPLTDSAPLIAADALGFFEAEGLEVELQREVSWATLRDRLLVGALDGAHLLAPMALHLAAQGGMAPVLAALRLSHGGATVTLSGPLAEAAGPEGRGLPQLVARRRAQGDEPLTFAVVYPHALHNYLLRAWLADAGLDPASDVRLTVAAPSRMAELLAQGAIEGFCAGEPWGSAAEASGAGRIVLRGEAHWPAAPDKVLALARPFAVDPAAPLGALQAALGQAVQWCARAENHGQLAELLAQRLGVAARVIAPSLARMEFAAEPANPADALWLLSQMQRWGQIPADEDLEALAQAVFRPDLCA